MPTSTSARPNVSCDAMRAVGLLAVLCACTSGSEAQRDHYVDSVIVPVDCHAAPSALVAFEPARPGIVFSDDRVTTDGGATWRGLYDGERPVERISPPVALGDGRWFTGTTSTDGSNDPPPTIEAQRDAVFR